MGIPPGNLAINLINEGGMTTSTYVHVLILRHFRSNFMCALLDTRQEKQASVVNFGSKVSQKGWASIGINGSLPLLLLTYGNQH